jgi:hypothetical protein
LSSIKFSSFNRNLGILSLSAAVCLLNFISLGSSRDWGISILSGPRMPIELAYAYEVGNIPRVHLEPPVMPLRQLSIPKAVKQNCHSGELSC